MLLTLFSIEKAKPKEKPYKLSDGNGLHLLVKPNGSKLWRLRYRFGGKQNMIGLGSFPEVSLASARRKRDSARELVASGTDPSRQRKTDKIAAAAAASNTFGVIVEEYLQKLRDEGKSESTISKNQWLLQDLAQPLTKRPMTKITPAEILDILKKIEKSGRRDTARRLRGVLGSVFRFAIVTLRATNDPTFALRGALLAPIVQHRPAIVEERQLGSLMLAIDEYDGWPTLRAALLLLPLTMTRPGDVRHMRRSEIVFAKALSLTRTAAASTSCCKLSRSMVGSFAGRSQKARASKQQKSRRSGANAVHDPAVADMRGGKSSRKLVEFYVIELSQLADGAIHVHMTATTVDEEEPELLSQEVACERAVSVEAALAIIRDGLLVDPTLAHA